MCQRRIMNFYFEATKVLDKLDAKQGSIKSLITTVADKDRKRTAALVIETLKCQNFPPLFHRDYSLM